MEQLYQEIIRGHFLSDIPLFGINAPVFIWLASFFLSGATVLWMGFFLRQLVPVILKIRKMSKFLNNLPNHLNGLDLSKLDQFREIFEKDAYFKKLWGLFEASFVKVVKDDQDRFFAGKPPETVFSFHNMVEKQINMNFWNAVPSLLTSSGLFCTFTAILIALMGVTVNPATQQVTGIQVLINGLSGKFVSSVTALGWAILFSLLEKFAIHNLEVRHIEFVQKLASLFPVETTEKLLARVEFHLSEQSLAFKQFNTDLSSRLKESFSESVGPTFNKMVDTLSSLQLTQQELNQHISSIAQSGQDEIAGRIEGLVQKLELSLIKSFETLANELRNVFMQSTQGQFDSLAQEISKTAELLQTSNINSANFQQMVDKMIQELRSSTGATLEKVAETLTISLSSFKDSTTAFSDQMNQTLSAIIEKMAGNSEKVIVRANETVEQASRATSGIGDAWSALEGASETLKTTISSMSPFLLNVKEAAEQWTKLEKEMNMMISSLRQVQEGQQRLAGQLGDQMRSVIDGMEKSEKIAKNYEIIFQKYQLTIDEFDKVFNGLDERLGNILKRISSDMGEYQQTLHSGLEKLASTGDQYFTNISEKLRLSITELDDTINEFSEILEKARNGSNGWEKS